VIQTRPRTGWQAPAALLAGIVALHARTLGSGFINDDYLFLESFRRHGLGSIFEPAGLANYFRPLSRELWFGGLGLLTGGDPLGFHAVQLLLFVGALVLLADLLAVAAPPGDRWVTPAALLGILFYAVLPFQHVNLAWISCAQDLLALNGVLGAFALHRRGRWRWALVAYGLACLAKESALPFPGAIFLWEWWVGRRPPRRAFAQALPYTVALVPWAAGELALRAHSASAARFAFGGTELAATFTHLVQALAGVENAPGWLRSWTEARPSVVAFVLVAAAAIWLPERSPATESEPAPAAPAGRLALFAAGWMVLFALPVWPVVYFWSSYYFTIAAAGGALLVTLAARPISRWTWVLAAGVLLWWHAAGVAAPAFGVAEDPWIGTSHFTPFYLDRAAKLSGDMRAALTRLLPRVPRGSRFFFATLPPWAGFQLGNGPSIRQLYKDDSLESYFYSQFSDSTADRAPNYFLYWNGAGFEPLYPNAAEPYFRVGMDLLLLGRPAGAVWAFRRDLETGGQPLDDWYWLGWGALWSDQRPLAERAWKQWGAADDTAAYVLALRQAKGSLEDRDTVQAQRHLIAAVKAGVGRPEAHAMLGLLLQRVNAEYALLETQVATRLKPDDWLARRDLVAGLVAAHLDEPAARELAEFQALRPGWRSDTVAVRLATMLAARQAPGSGVAVFGPGGYR